MQIKLKGSKSITNRALLLAHLAKLSPRKLQNTGECDDTFQMKKGLKQLTRKTPGKINLGNAGTTTRFLTSLAATLNKDVTITGSKRMKERPIKPLTDALNKLGAKITTSPSGCPPLHIKASKLKGGTVTLPGNISSQYISSLLMIAPLTEKGITIRITGELASKPYIEMTIKLMKKFGVKVETSKNFKTLRVRANQKYKAPSTLFIEGDASSASYLGAYAALNPGKTVTITNIPKPSIQGDIAFLSYLRKMGCKTSHTGNKITITGPKNLKSLGEADMNETPDLVMTFAVLSALTPGTTRITNISNLRIKESDRLLALKNELTKLGAKVRTGRDYIEIRSTNRTISTSTKPKRISIKTYSDHRIAMAFGVLKKTIMPKLKIQNPSVVRKSYPEFWSDLNQLNRNPKNG